MEAEPIVMTASEIDGIMLELMGVSVACALLLILSNHYSGPGTGDRPCDYWRPRLHAPHPTGQRTTIELSSIAAAAKFKSTKGGYQSLESTE